MKNIYFSARQTAKGTPNAGKGTSLNNVQTDNVQGTRSFSPSDDRAMTERRPTHKNDVHETEKTNLIRNCFRDCPGIVPRLSRLDSLSLVSRQSDLATLQQSNDTSFHHKISRRVALLFAVLVMSIGQAWGVNTYFTNGETIFIIADSKTNSAWNASSCVKVWFNKDGASSPATSTGWLSNLTDEGESSYQLYYTIVPSTGEYNQCQLQRFASNCSDWWNSNGDIKQKDRSDDNYNTFYSANSGNSGCGWKNLTYEMYLSGSTNAWGGNIGTLEDKGSGVFQYTFRFTADATSYQFKMHDSWNRWYGTDVTLNGFVNGLTYDITGTVTLPNGMSSLAMTKELATYAITYDAGDYGTGSVEGGTKTSGTNATLSSSTFSRSYYTQTGWSTSDGGDKVYELGGSYTNDAAITLYPFWTEDTHTVGVAKNLDAGGTINTTSVSGVGIATASSTITATPYFGYRFTGWTIPDGVTIASGSVSSNSITIHATADSKTITANFAREYAFIEGNFAIQNSTRGAETKTGDSWQDNSTAIPMEYDAVNHLFYLHTYRTPSELAEQVNSAAAYFYVKTSTSTSSIVDGVKYSAHASGAYQDLSAYGNSHKKATGTSANNFRMTGTEAGYAILYINGTHIWYELESALSYWGGEGATGDAPAARTYYSYESAQTAAANTYSKTGYTFSGWNTAADGSGMAYAAGATNVAMNAAEVCLCAQWTGRPYNITYYDADTTAINTLSPNTYICGAGDVILPTEVTTKDGYTFDGWIKYGADRRKRTKIDNGSYGDYRFIATWKQTVTLNMQGVVSNLTPTVMYDSTALVDYSSSATFTSALLGFYTAPTDGTKVLNADGSFAASNVTDYITNDRWRKAGATTLYAHWTAVSLPNTFDKSNMAAYSSDMTWHGDGDLYFDYGPTSAQNLGRWVEWQVDLIPCNYTVTEVFDVPDTGGHEWHLELRNNAGDSVAGYNTTRVWEAGGERTENTKWNLTELSAGRYTLRVTNAFSYAQPKLKSITLSSVNYTVTYNANGGSCATASETQSSCGATLTLPTATRDGYTFAGWYNGSTKIGNADDSYVPTEDVTLKAQWICSLPQTLDKNNYAFSGGGITGPKENYFDYRDGTSSHTDGYVEWIVDVEKCTYTIILNGTYPNGHQWETTLINGSGSTVATCTFNSNYTEGDLSETKSWDLSGLSSAGVYTLRVRNILANGEPKLLNVAMNLYTVTYNANGGTCAKASEMISACGQSVTVPSATRTGCTFTGWTDNEEGTGTIYKTGDVYTPSNNVTLYAQWTANNYTITLNANGGTGGSASVEATYNSSTLPAFDNPAKSGNVFAGWYNGSGGIGNLVINNIGELKADVSDYTGAGGIWIAAENKTLYAKWILLDDVSDECWEEGVYKCGYIENFDTPNPSGTAAWSTATNWGKGVLPTAETDVVITTDMTVDVVDAKAKSIVLKNGSASLTIAAGKALVVATTVKKTADGETLVATTPSDLTIQSSAAGTGALITGAADAATQATVEFYTKARNEGGYVNQYIGIPYNGMNAYDGYYGTALYRFDVDADAWRVLGANGHMDAFAAYNLLRRESEPATLSMTGTLNLPGTTETKDQVLTLTRRDVDVSAPALTENLFANSWTAPIDIKAMATEDFVGAEATIYIFNAGTKTEQQTHSGTMNDHDNTIAGQWVCLPVEAAELLAKEWDLTVIPSMQAFAVYANGDAGATHTLTLDYKKVVYDPAVDSGAEIQPARAPRRASGTDKPEIIRLNVTGESGNADQLILFLREDFSTGFDNGWEGRKIEGAAYTPQLYAVTDEGRMAISAQPDAESTLIGFKAGSEDEVYTFALDYEGEETEPLYLLDTHKDTYTRVEKDATYTFSTDDKSDHNRFVLTRNRAPQVVTGTEEVQGDHTKTVKFIENDQLYILRNGVIYDTTGKRVK